MTCQPIGGFFLRKKATEQHGFPLKQLKNCYYQLFYGVFGKIKLISID